MTMVSVDYLPNATAKYVIRLKQQVSLDKRIAWTRLPVENFTDVVVHSDTPLL